MSTSLMFALASITLPGNDRGTITVNSNSNTGAEDFNLDKFFDDLGLPADGADTTSTGATHEHHGSSNNTLDQNLCFPTIATSTPQTRLHMPQNSNYFDVEDLILNGALSAQTAGSTPQPSDSSLSTETDDSDHDADSSYDSSRRKRSRMVKQQTTGLFTTPSGHRRGPLNGGCFFPNQRPLPDPIPEFLPQPYCGPAAVAKGQQPAINTQGKRVKYRVYTTIADTHPQFALQHGLSYDNRGRLSPEVLFDRESFSAFVRNHPLGKNLWFRLEKFPANCKGFGSLSNDHPTYNLCRARDCPSKEKGQRGFHDGTIRIAIEEVLGRLPRGERFENSPYFCAGYLHIDCLENLMDIGQLIRAGMLRPKPREFHPKEPNTSKTEPQVLCPPAKLVTCFEEFCKRVIQLKWDGYLYNLADRLQTYVWLSVQKKGKMTTYDAPSDMRKEDALELLKRRPVDPNWGGGRRPGLAMKTVKKAEARGKRGELVGPGTGRNSEKAQKTAERIIGEIEEVLSDSVFEDGDAWLRDCYIPLANPELYGQGGAEILLASPPTARTTRGLRRIQEPFSGRSSKSPFPRPSGITKSQARVIKRELPFDVDIYTGGNYTDSRTLALDDGNTFFHATDGTQLSLKRPRKDVSPIASMPQFTGFTQQPYYPTPQLQLSPTTQRLFFPPIQTPTAMDFEMSRPPELFNPMVGNLGFDFAGVLDETQSPFGEDSSSSSQGWGGTIDPQLLETVLVEGTGDNAAAELLGQDIEMQL